MSKAHKVLVALLALSVLAVAPGAAADVSVDAPSPDVSTTVEKDTHNMGEYGADALKYTDNQGEVVSLDANLDGETPISYLATHVEHSEYLKITNSDGDVTGTSLDADQWTANGLTVSDETITGDVEAVNFASSGLTSGSSASATFKNFSITSDEQRKFLQIAADINSLDSGATVSIIVNDDNGDSVTVESFEGADATQDNILAGGVGDGAVTQVQIGEMTNGADINNIESVTVEVADGDADLSVSMLDLDDHQPVVFGETATDVSEEDSEEPEFEYSDVVQPNGEIEVTSLESLGAQLDEAQINNLNVDVVFNASHAADSQFEAEELANDPVFDYRTDIHYTFDIPTDQYDLTFANTEVTDTTVLPGDRYASVGLAYDVGDTDYADISYADNSAAYSSTASGDEVTLDSTPSIDNKFAVHYGLDVTSDEWSSMQDAGIGGPIGQGNDGSFFTSIPFIGTIVVGLTALWAKFRNRTGA